MKRILLIIFILCLAIGPMVVTYWYQDSLWFTTLIRTISLHTVDLVTTGLTMSSILFMIHSFVIPYTKENVYDKNDYINHLKSFYGDKWPTQHYRPIKNLSNYLLLSITTSLISSIVILFGWLSVYITAIAISLVIVSIFGIFISLYAMKQTFNHMFKKYE